MQKVITSEKLPIKLWLDDIEPGAMAQARNLANLPFSFKHIAIMPDAHEGYGMPIGGVLATKDVIIPNAVGVDIGCGMCCVRTSLKEIDTARIKSIMSEIREVIPLGFDHHKRQQNPDLMPQDYDKRELPVVEQEYNSALHQIGTLGGGNHFIEIQSGSDGHIWLMVHSGSRNIGLKVAEFYNKLAETLNEKWDENFNRKAQLAYLPLDNEKGKLYISEMNYCVEFALSNRQLMMHRIMEIFQNETYCDFIPFEGNLITNIAHNFARVEKHFRTNVMVHRKGATLATKETIGIIPGSQGAKSYIVKGKGNKQSFESCSHGAGRKMGRGQARRNLNLEDEIRRLNEKGIIHSIRHQKDLDEAAGAYKDIDTVMKNQQDLVDILIELEPLAVIKG
ncbi:MAG: RtcB family protein [FCB group bacterium]|jgi:tRNA-splicing ligase RtcB